MSTLWKRPRRTVTGMGDIVAIVAQPIARAIDSVAGTSIQTCGACQRRREKLNQAFPLKTNS